MRDALLSKGPQPLCHALSPLACNSQQPARLHAVLMARCRCAGVEDKDGAVPATV